MAILLQPPPRQNGELEITLAQITRRLRLARWVRHAARGALVGMGVALVAVIFAHFDLLPDWLPLEAVIPIVILLGIGVGTITTYVRPISTMQAARLAETRLGLKERLSSALEFEKMESAPRDPEAALLMRLQQEDAAAYARTLKPKDAVPLRVTWEVKALLPALALLIIALVIPNLPIFVPPAVANDRAIVKKSGQKLTQTAKLIQKQADTQHLPATSHAAHQMLKLGQRMAQGHMTKKEAMRSISQLTKQMQNQQRQLAQTNSGVGAGGKSLADAGNQLAQALQSQAVPGENTPGAKGANGAGQKHTNNGAAKGGQKSSGQNGSKPGQPGQRGFNVPNTSGHKTGAQPSQSGQKNNSPATPEMKKAAQAMQQGNFQSLSQQLRQLAQRAQSGHMSPSEQQQAGQDLQKLSDALKGTPLTQTQQHAQAAADAMKQGNAQQSAQEMQKAAAAADKEMQQQADRQGMQDAQGSLQNSQGEIGQANSPGDIQPGQPGQGNGSGSGSLSAYQKYLNSQGQGQGKGQGNSPGSNPGDQYGNGHGNGNGTGGGPGMRNANPGPRGTKNGHPKGGPHWLGMHSDSPRNGKVYFGKPGQGIGGKAGPPIKVHPGVSTGSGNNPSSVPYYNYVAPAQKAAESAMDKEDIPPAYRDVVRRYYGGLSPTTTTAPQ